MVKKDTITFKINGDTYYWLDSAVMVRVDNISRIFSDISHIYK